MNHKTYRQALDALHLPVQGVLTEKLLGVTRRQSAYYAAGYCPVSRRIAAILRLTAALVGRGMTVPEVVDVIRGRILEIPQKAGDSRLDAACHKGGNFQNGSPPGSEDLGAPVPLR